MPRVSSVSRCGKVIRPGSLPLRRRDVQLSAVGEGRNAIENGIHSVGTKPIGSTMPSLRGLPRQLARVDHRNRVAGHIGHIEPAAAIAFTASATGSAPK